MERDIEVGVEKIPITRLLLRQRISADGKGDPKEAGKLLEEYEMNLLKLPRNSLECVGCCQSDLMLTRYCANAEHRRPETACGSTQ